MIVPKGQASDALVLHTIGYEGLDVPRFIKCLTYHDVKALVDVRELPFSRKKGFSKAPLSQAVQHVGIHYTHIRALGSPSKIRKRVKEDGNYAAFFKSYDAYLAKQVDALSHLQKLLEDHHRVCLMCFEADAGQCHRSRIADRVARTSATPVSVEPLKTWVSR